MGFLITFYLSLYLFVNEGASFIGFAIALYLLAGTLGKA
jgi:hypothetical protein